VSGKAVQTLVLGVFGLVLSGVGLASGTPERGARQAGEDRATWRWFAKPCTEEDAAKGVRRIRVILWVGLVVRESVCLFAFNAAVA
jgi:hypothetical protein